LHRGEWDSAAGLIDDAGALLAEITAALQDHPDILHAGFVSDAAKEYAEARITEALFRARPIPGFADLGIDPVPFLHGLGESVGEMRRRLLDLLRAGELDPAQATLDAMDQIVDLLAEMDYPDGMTAGLRRTTDVSRSLVERSRSDLTATVVQERLREDLRRS
jgi:translin